MKCSFSSCDDEETPFYGDEKKADIIKRKNPLPPTNPESAKYKKLKDFLKEVFLLLLSGISTII